MRYLSYLIIDIVHGAIGAVVECLAKRAARIAFFTNLLIGTHRVGKEALRAPGEAATFGLGRRKGGIFDGVETAHGDVARGAVPGNNRARGALGRTHATLVEGRVIDRVFRAAL